MRRPFSFSPWVIDSGFEPKLEHIDVDVPFKFGAGWPENHRGHGRRLRAPSQPAYCSAPGLAAAPQTLLLKHCGCPILVALFATRVGEHQNMNPASTTPRGWVAFAPDVPKPKPGVILVT